MSNTVRLNTIKITTLHNGSVDYGYEIYDNYATVREVDDGTPLTDKELFQHVNGGSDEAWNLCDFAQNNGAHINGTWYEAGTLSAWLNE